MTGTGERASQPGDSGMVLVLNSGSSSVKFALVDPGSGQRVTDGLAERPRHRATHPGGGGLRV